MVINHTTVTPTFSAGGVAAALLHLRCVPCVILTLYHSLPQSHFALDFTPNGARHGGILRRMELKLMAIVAVLAVATYAPPSQGKTYGTFIVWSLALVFCFVVAGSFCDTACY